MAQQDRTAQEIHVQNKDKEFGILNTYQKDIQELRTQTGFINGELTGIKARIDKVETNIAVVNETISNSGFQLLSGDVGIISVFLICILIFAIISSYFQIQILKLKKTINK